MRKQDIKPGVVYAYQHSGKYSEPHPVIFLSLDLYSDRRRGAEGPRFRPALVGDKPHSGMYGSGSTGYLIAEASTTWRSQERLAEAIAKLPGLTLADATAPGDRESGDLIGFRVLPSLTPVLGPWEAVTAERREQDEADRRRREREAAARKALDDRAAKVRTVLIAAGLSPRYSGPSRELVLSLDDAEKLSSLLAAKKD